jgi:hypothetical protein
MPEDYFDERIAEEGLVARTGAAPAFTLQRR